MNGRGLQALFFIFILSTCAPECSGAATAVSWRLSYLQPAIIAANCALGASEIATKRINRWALTRHAYRASERDIDGPSALALWLRAACTHGCTRYPHVLWTGVSEDVHCTVAIFIRGLFNRSKKLQSRFHPALRIPLFMHSTRVFTIQSSTISLLIYSREVAKFFTLREKRKNLKRYHF